MKLASLVCLAGLIVAGNAVAAEKETKVMTSPLTGKMKAIDGKEVDLAQFKGKVVLLVNVASRCGYTKQYKDLQALYEKYGKDGLVVIGVPANEFGKQEPGTDAEIAEFCSTKYSVTFPMMSKVVVKGEGICPLYDYLTSKTTNPSFAGPISWNFEKFLIGRDGTVKGRYKSKVAPMDEELTTAIQKELETK